MLLAKGEIVVKPEVTPPTVPMDFNWARVSIPLLCDYMPL